MGIVTRLFLLMALLAASVTCFRSDTTTAAGRVPSLVISVASFQNATQSGDNRTCEYHEIEGQERNVKSTGTGVCSQFDVQ